MSAITRSSDWFTRRTRIAGLVVVAVIAALVVSQFVVGGSSTTITAYFAQTKGLYEGDAVSVLGVKVGKIVSIEPQPESVKVVLRVDDGVTIPRAARAVIISPSLVAVRKLELAPVYDGGPALADGATIPISRTVVPVEWDDVKSELIDLSTALGPNTGDPKGALAGLLTTSAANLRGNGARLNQTVALLSAAMKTLDEGKGDLFTTVRNLELFVAALKSSDEAVGSFNTRLADVSGYLADDSGQLSAALGSSASAFRQVKGFLKNNRGELTTSLAELDKTAKILADNRQALADILQVAPTALSNFYNIYDGNNHDITGALSTANLDAPALTACSLIFGITNNVSDCVAALQPLAQYIKLPQSPIGVTPLERNGNGDESSSVPNAGDLLGQLTGLLGGGK